MFKLKWWLKTNKTKTIYKFSGLGRHDSNCGEEPYEVSHRESGAEQPEVVHPADEGGGQRDEGESVANGSEQQRKR